MSRVAVATALAMIAFAANSVLCRMALRGTHIDPATFTTVRLVTGAVTMWGLLRIMRGPLSVAGSGSWASALTLVLYAIAFSFAYVGLSAGTGALLLFGTVQLVMISGGLLGGERMRVGIALGWGIAAAGVVVLLLPGVSAPPLRAAALMVFAGIFWALYSLQGRRSGDALRDTAGNFVRSAPATLLVSALLWSQRSWDSHGAALAVLSGAIASGVGYVIWYTVLPRLSAIAAGNAQLSVPVIAAFGGVMLFGESLTPRLLISAVLVLGGIALALRQAQRAIPVESG